MYRHVQEHSKKKKEKKCFLFVLRHMKRSVIEVYQVA